MLPLKKIFRALTRAERRTFFAAIGISIIACGALFAHFVYGATKVVPADGGSWTEGVLGQPSALNPVLAESGADKDLTHLLFINLADAADKIDADKSGKIWKVRLKENVFWSDGQQLTSDDVVFTVSKIQDSDTNSPLAVNWQGAAANRTSQLEITFNLANPYAFFGDSLRELYILPKHIYADVPPANWRLSDYMLKPVASGPYTFVSYDKKDNGFITAYHLAANPRFVNGVPHIANLNLVFFTNQDELLKSFNGGQIDGFGLTGALTDLRIRRPYDNISFALPTYYAVFFNPSSNPALADANVRRALDLATDRTALSANLFLGDNRPLYGPIPPGIQGADPLPATTSSVDVANAILDAAGWARGDDLMRAKSTKTSKIPLAFKLSVPQLPFLTASADRLVKTWSSLGVNVSVVSLPPDAELQTAIKNRDYESLLLGNTLERSGDLFAFWHSSERFYPGSNLALYSNPHADNLIETIRKTFDPAARRTQFRDLQTVIVNDHPAVFLYAPSYSYIISPALEGVSASLVGEPAERFAGIQNWYVRTTRAWK